MYARGIALLVALLASATPSPALGDGATLDRIRTTDTRTGRLLQIGLEGSPILRALVAGIEAMPVVVYVGQTRELPIGVDGQTALMGRSGRARFIRVAIRHGLPNYQFIAVLAHELEHVREVAIRPNVQDSAAMASLYRQIGHQDGMDPGGTWDSEGARWVGAEVRRELTSRRSMQGSRP